MFQRVSLAALILVVVFIAPAQAQTVDEIVNKYVAATGGVETWKSIESMVIISRSKSFSFDLYWKKPNHAREEVSTNIPGMGLYIRSFDGATGWTLNPMEGSQAPRRMSEKETLDLLQTANGWRDLIDHKANGYRLELVGKESIDGNPAYKVKMTRPTGDIVNIFFDAKTFLQIRRTRHVRSPWGEEMDVVTVIGDYRPVGGLLLPHNVGGSVYEYKVNVPMDEKGFRMPGKNDSDQNQPGAGEKTKDDSKSIDSIRTPAQRAELLQANPTADINGDGTLDLEEAWLLLSKQNIAQNLLPVGATAPDWTLRNSRGETRRLSEYRGRVVVMDFWAVWCAPCHTALPWLQKVHNDLSNRGVVVFGVSTDERGGDPIQLMKDRSYTYELLLNGEAISKSYGVVGMPTFYIVGVDGRIIYSGSGADATLEQRRRALLEGYLTQKGM
jgi:peroxiredoxin/outer membrane lipoprotein-sorting protein